MTRPSSHSSPSPPASREPRARAQAASPPFAAEATAAAAAAASAASTAVASPRAAERGRGPPLHGVRCGRGIGRIGALRSRMRWPTRWAASRSESRLGTARSAGEAGSSRVDAPRTSRPAARPRPQPPAEASCGRLVCREASACAWLVVRLTCRARGASEAAPRTLGPCVMVGGAGGPPAEVRPWWWPERVSRVGARLRMPLEDSLASGRLSKPRRWLKLGGRADRVWGAKAEFRDRV